MLFLPGLASTAHAFDDIAPRLTDRFRVLALTPRAHGESESRDTALTVERAADDVRVFLDSVSIDRAHLVGHSISGATLTAFAARHPGRVGKLVYLDATFDHGGADEAEEEGRAVARPRPEQGFSSAGEYRAWAEKYFFGTWTNALEADMWASGSAIGADAERAGKARVALLADATAHPQRYRLVRAPGLALWAEKTLEWHYFWIDRADTGMVARARDHLRARRLWERRGVDRFRREMGKGRVVAFPAHHWMFVTNEERVLREVRAFCSGADEAAAATGRRNRKGPCGVLDLRYHRGPFSWGPAHRCLGAPRQVVGRWQPWPVQRPLARTAVLIATSARGARRAFSPRCS